MGSSRRADSAAEQRDLRIRRQEAQGESSLGQLPCVESGSCPRVAPKRVARTNQRRRRVIHFQRFFCPQCGFPIKKFEAAIGDNGYHMEGHCPKCVVTVSAAVQMSMEFGMLS